MVASYVGEYGDFGEFGEFLSNHLLYVNQFHTWWPAIFGESGEYGDFAEYLFNEMQHIAWMFTRYLCNIYAGLKNNRLYTLSQIDNVKTGFSGVKHKLSVHQNLAWAPCE